MTRFERKSEVKGERKRKRGNNGLAVSLQKVVDMEEYSA